MNSDSEAIKKKKHKLRRCTLSKNKKVAYNINVYS